MLPNIQPIEKIDQRADGTLDFHSIFFTLQGEGPFAGHRSVFVRLAGCNLQCPGCDTEYTNGRVRLTIAAIVGAVQGLFHANDMLHDHPDRLVVITGGEPTRQNLDGLVEALLERGMTVQIETNGVLAPSDYLQERWHMDDGLVFVVSPKTQRINPAWYACADAFKYVIRAGEVDPFDGLPTRALGHKATPRVARPPTREQVGYQVPIYINPMDEQDEVLNARNAAAVAQSALRCGYIAGVQMHKIFNLE